MTRAETIQEVLTALGQMKRTMRYHFHKNDDLMNLSSAQLELLFALHHLQPMSHKALAANLQLTPGAVSQLLDGLDEAGYIVRNVKPSDRRVSYLSVSRAGTKRLEELRKIRNKMFTEAFEDLSDAELQSYLSIQKKMIAKFEAKQSEITTKHKEH